MPGTKRSLPDSTTEHESRSSAGSASNSSAISEPSSAGSPDANSTSKRADIEALLESKDLPFGQSPTTVSRLIDGTPFELEKGEATKLLKLLTTRIKLIIASFPFTEATTEEQITLLYQNLDNTLEAIEKIYHWHKTLPPSTPSSAQKRKTKKVIEKLLDTASEGTEIVLHKFYPTIVEKKLESGDLILILHELDVLSKFVVLFKHGLPYLFNTSPLMDGYKKEECPLLDENYPALIYKTCVFLLKQIERLKTDYPEAISEMVEKKITFIEENMDLFRQKLNAKEMKEALKKQLPKEEPPTYRLEYRVEHGAVAEIAYEEILLDHFRDPTSLAKKTIRKLTKNSKNIASFCESLSCNRDAMFRQCLELFQEDQGILLKNILKSQAISTTLSPSALCDLATALSFNQNSVNKSELLNQLILRSQALIFRAKHEEKPNLDNTLEAITKILSSESTEDQTKKEYQLTKYQKDQLTEITEKLNTLNLSDEIVLKFSKGISDYLNPAPVAKKAKIGPDHGAAKTTALSTSKQRNTEGQPKTTGGQSTLFSGHVNEKENSENSTSKATVSSP